MKKLRYPLFLAGLFVLTVLIFALLPGSLSMAASDITRPATPIVNNLEMTVGASKLINSSQKISRSSVANEKVADVVGVSPYQLYINAKSAGVTNIMLWGAKGHVIGVYKVKVRHDLVLLKDNLNKILPDERLELHSVGDSVLLSGRVSSEAVKAKAEAVAKAYAPKNLTSILTLGSNRQVMLKVRFAEVSRSELKRMSINIGYIAQTGFLFTMLGNLIAPSFDASQGVWDIPFSPQVGIAGGWNVGATSYLGFLDALAQNGDANILAEPTLVTNSGKPATFLAGGEYPVPVTDRNGAVTIYYKEYGVKLMFEPEITKDNRIILKVEPEVSDLDFSVAVQTDGFVVPGLTSRKATTELELDNGGTFAIAGLLKDELSQNLDKVPWLGDVPILGALFRSQKYRTRKTDIVIVVTANIVENGQPQAKNVVIDDWQKPSDFDFYFMGMMAAPHKESPGPSHSVREIDGRVGFDLAD